MGGKVYYLVVVVAPDLLETVDEGGELGLLGDGLFGEAVGRYEVHRGQMREDSTVEVADARAQEVLLPFSRAARAARSSQSISLSSSSKRGPSLVLTLART